MTLIPYLDKRRFVPESAETWIEPRTVSGGVTLSGDEQIIASAAERWRASYSGILARTSSDGAEIRRFATAMAGRFNSVLLPFYESGRAPWPTDPWGRIVNPAHARIKSLDGTAFADNVDVLIDSLIFSFALGAGSIDGGGTIAVAQSSTMRLQMNFALFAPPNLAPQGLTPTIPIVGAVFSVASRAYIITRINSSGPVSGGGGVLEADVTLSPRLRTDVPQGTILNFTSPVCEMRFVSDDQGRLAVSNLKHGSASFDLVEVS